MRIQTDPDPGFVSQKVEFLHEKYTNEGRKPGLFANIGKFPCSWIRIQDSQMNADPGGSRSTTLA
jgi:hypothetical protein